MKFFLLSFLLILLIGCSRTPSHSHAHGSDASHAEDHSVEFTCSMHPQIRQAGPGKCPLCAMDLIPVSTQGSSSDWTITLSDQAVRLAQVQTSPVRRLYVDKKIHLPGKITLDETRTRTLAARFPGRVERLFVDYVGVAVNEGDHLAVLFSPTLLTAQTELLNALRFDGQGLSIRGAREKLRLLGLSDSAIQSIEQSGNASDQLQVDSPVSGIVIQKEVNEGDYVETGRLLFRVADMDHLWLVMDAYEADLPWLRYGQKVAFTVPSLPGQQFHGIVSFIQPVVDENTQTIKVRVNVENKRRLLKPGMYAQGVIHSSLDSQGQVHIPELHGKWISPMHPEVVRDQAGQCDVCGMDLIPFEQSAQHNAHTDSPAQPPLVIPATSVLLTGKRAVVYVALPNQESPTYEGREIILGPKAGDFYIVESGLQEGDAVVTHGAFKIDSSLQIQGKKSMMSLPVVNESAQAEISIAAPREPYPGFYTQFDSMLAHYFLLQEALASDNLLHAQQQAAVIAELLQQVRMDYRDVRISAIQRIQESKDLESARRAFEPLSDWITNWLRNYGTQTKSGVWRMSCPMVFGNHTAYWLQNHSTLRNPYHGSGMLHCGSVEEIVVQPHHVPEDHHE
jgi:Cu(I)/Ag(I) efflux system membrane fusion protein